MLILDPFGRNVAPFTTAVSSFRTTLARELGEPVDIYELPLELTRFSGPEGETPLVTFLDGRLKEQSVDLVVPVGTAGMQFAARHRDSLFPNTPVLVLASEPRMLSPELLKTNATAVAQKVSLPGLVEDILQLQPQTTNIVVVFGASALERFWTEQCQREFQVFTNRVGFTWVNDLTMEQILKHCASLPPRSFILHVLFIVDAAGVACERNEALRRLHEVANAPVFGFFASEFGLGSIGGRLFQDIEVGAQAAHTAVRILRGERPESISVQIMEATAPTYDWRELRRWGISEANLPAGSVIQFRQLTLWQRYRWHITGIAIFCLLQSALIVGLLVNRSKRKRTEEQVRQLSLALEQSPVAVIITDLEGRMIYVNRQFCEISGYSLTECLGQNSRMLKSGESPPEIYREMWATITSGSIWRGEFHNRRKNGELYWEWEVISPLFDAAGKISHFVGVKEDITERKRSEDALLRQRSELAHLSRVAMLGELSGSMAHELNQPLTAILSNAQAAQRFLAVEGTDLAEVRDILADIVSEDKRAGEIIRRLRLLLKKGEVQHQTLNVNEVVREVLKLVRSDLVNQNVTTQTELAPGLPVVHGDRVQLQQVLLNLVMNGCEAMTGTEKSARQLTIRTDRSEDGSVCISVTDGGPGIAPEKLEQIFESFYTTKPQGMGLGLTVCRTIITAHHGRLWATSKPGRGATVWLTLPATGH